MNDTSRVITSIGDEFAYEMAASQVLNLHGRVVIMPFHSNEQTPDPNAFWNINVPPEAQTLDCPEYLSYCLLDHAKDRAIIATPDSQFTRLSWAQVKELVRSDRLDLFQRVPSELRRYREFFMELNKQYDGVNSFLLKERLRWKGTEPSAAVPFTNPGELSHFC